MSQNWSSNKTNLTARELLRIAAKPTMYLLLLIMICSFLAHYLTDSETLEEYANNNPRPAYDTAEENIPETEHNTAASDTAHTIPPADTEHAIPPTDTEHAAMPTDTATSANETADVPQDVPLPDSGAADEEQNSMASDAERTTYQPGFYYEPLSSDIIERITGISYPETGCTVPYEDLNYVGLLYIDFNGEEQTGELICNKAIAQDMVEIFHELYLNQYQLERIRLIDEYGGDDTLSMENNNTSCFNYRVVDGTSSLSKHALGCAIDINPYYNPYVVFNKDGSGETYISPKGSEVYADRSQNFPYKIDENDLCYKLFIEHGFTWGGNWNSCKDYQHFQIVLP